MMVGASHDVHISEFKDRRKSVSIARHLGFAALTVLVGFSSLTLHAQSTTGTILGQVTDPSGARVAKAIVIVVNMLTGETHTMQTNDEGEYVVPNLPVGTYSV
jgi:hypothetical protein